MGRIIPNPSEQTPGGDARFRELQDALTGLQPRQVADVEALIHAFASGQVTAEAFDEAMATEGTAGVRDLLRPPETHPTHADLFGTTPVPCPPWCELPTGHGYDSESLTGEERFRYHQLDVATVVVENGHEATIHVVAGEVLVDGVTTVSPPVVDLDAGGLELTAHQTRQLAAELIKAADKLAEIQRPES